MRIVASQTAVRSPSAVRPDPIGSPVTSSHLSRGNAMAGGLLVVQVVLLGLEVAVAIIQSYVFAILRTLYSKEAIH